jgi:hypothetical protein
MTRMPKANGINSLSILSVMKPPARRDRSENQVAAPETRNSIGICHVSAKELKNWIGKYGWLFFRCHGQVVKNIPQWKTNTTSIVITRTQSRSKRLSDVPTAAHYTQKEASNDRGCVCVYCLQF